MYKQDQLKVLEMDHKAKMGTDIRGDSLKWEVTFLRAKQKMREEMDLAWKDFFEKNPDKKEEDVWGWVEERLRSNQDWKDRGKGEITVNESIAFRTMLVEDGHSFRRAVKFYLHSEFPSMSIVEASDGIEALKEIGTCPPNLIFMDIKLPGENGLELTKKIKASHPNIIITILTSYDLQEIQEAATQCKADYLFSKGSIATGKIAALVKSILLERGFNANGSMEAYALRREKIAPLILKRRIWWESVPEASSYEVYVSKDRTLLEPDHFSWETTPGVISKLVTGKTGLIIPEDWPEFPTEPGTYYIAITSRDDLGNQSDPLLLSGLFKFLAPSAPLRGGIEYLN